MRTLFLLSSKGNRKVDWGWTLTGPLVPSHFKADQRESSLTSLATENNSGGRTFCEDNNNWPSWWKVFFVPDTEFQWGWEKMSQRQVIWSWCCWEAGLQVLWPVKELECCGKRSWRTSWSFYIYATHISLV